MPSKTGESFVRLAALAGLAGGTFWGVKVVLDGLAPASRLTGVTDALFFVAPLLMTAGLAGLHARYAARITSLGRTGFVNGFIGLGLLVVGFASGLSFGAEEAMRVSSFGFLILAFGLVLLGLEVMKVAALPRWNFLPLVMGLLVPLGVIAGEAPLLRVALSALFGLGWVLLCLVLLSDAAEAD